MATLRQQVHFRLYVNFMLHYWYVCLFVLYYMCFKLYDLLLKHVVLCVRAYAYITCMYDVCGIGLCLYIMCFLQVSLHSWLPCPLRLEGMQEHQVWWRHVPNYWWEWWGWRTIFYLCSFQVLPVPAVQTAKKKFGHVKLCDLKIWLLYHTVRWKFLVPVGAQIQRLI